MEKRTKRILLTFIFAVVLLVCIFLICSIISSYKNMKDNWKVYMCEIYPHTTDRKHSYYAQDSTGNIYSVKYDVNEDGSITISYSTFFYLWYDLEAYFVFESGKDTPYITDKGITSLSIKGGKINIKSDDVDKYDLTNKKIIRVFVRVIK